MVKQKIKALVALLIINLLFPFITIASDCTQTSKGYIPLSDMSANDFYFSEEGGLYGNGSNAIPSGHLTKALEAVNQIQPLNSNGQPAADGKIVLLSIGMSNARQEFDQFLPLAVTDPTKNPHLVIINGAQGGVFGTTWATTEPPWNTIINDYLPANAVSPHQVQAIWMKHGNSAQNNPPTGLVTDGYADKLRIAIREVVKKAITKFPNLKVIYLTSRIYGGYATSTLNPEPYAYESAFSNRWVIEDQMNGDDPNDPQDIGYTKIDGSPLPILLWGPYNWADGIIPRSDGLTWMCGLDEVNSDFETDGTHPSLQGEIKVANRLLDFFTTNQTTAWFTNGSISPTPTAPLIQSIGDINLDGTVNIQDYVLLSLKFGQIDPSADLNKDGIVNIQDFIILSNNFGVN